MIDILEIDLRPGMTDDRYMRDGQTTLASNEMTASRAEEGQRENRPEVLRLSLQEDLFYQEGGALEVVVMGEIVTSETTLSQEGEAVAMTGIPESVTTLVPEARRHHSEPALDRHSGSHETRILSRGEEIQERLLHPFQTFHLEVEEEPSGVEVGAIGTTTEQGPFTRTIDLETLEVILEIASGTHILANTA